MQDVKFIMEVMGVVLITIVVLFAGYAKLGAISSKKQK
jgi:hypothetical protein